LIRLIDVIGRQTWLDGLGSQLQDLVTATFDMLGPDTRALRNLLHGTWLGHPLHPVLTDVALGGWTVAVTLDAFDDGTDDGALSAGADAAVGLGLLCALGSALTGANDWQHTDGTARRLGVAHALLNVGATGFMAASLIARLAGQRSSGRLLAALGIGAGTLSAYIGGDLVYDQQVGVNHASSQSGPDEFTALLADADLKDDEPRLAEVGGTRIVLLRHAGRIHALIETCSHLGGPLSEGTLRDGGIVCPWHGSRFDLDDGRVLDGPATFPVPSLDVRVENGQILVRGGAEPR
jgi:nitrite reductase/ring-hydroxylating ferredoxin subunit